MDSQQINPIILNACMSGAVRFMEDRDIEYIAKLLFDENGTFCPLPAATLSKIPQEDLMLFCNKYGIYSVPSLELIEFIDSLIPDKEKCIEIGAGNGIYGRKLGIKMTDNYMQHRKNRYRFNNVIAAYEQANVGLVRYGKDVEEREGREAVRFYKPTTVFASWVTQKYNPTQPHKKGNKYGIPWRWILNRQHVEQIIFVGNKVTHDNMEIMNLPHEEHQCTGTIFSRAIHSDQDRVFVWRK